MFGKFCKLVVSLILLSGVCISSTRDPSYSGSPLPPNLKEQLPIVLNFLQYVNKHPTSLRVCPDITALINDTAKEIYSLDRTTDTVEKSDWLKSLDETGKLLSEESAMLTEAPADNEEERIALEICKACEKISQFVESVTWFKSDRFQQAEQFSQYLITLEKPVQDSIIGNKKLKDGVAILAHEILSKKTDISEQGWFSSLMSTVMPDVKKSLKDIEYFIKSSPGVEADHFRRGGGLS